MKIIIYGYGKVGKAYEKYVKENKLAEIVAITDKKYSSNNNKKEDNSFISIDECKEIEYDYIIITPVNFESEIRKELILKGFCDDKIKGIYSYDIAGKELKKDKYCISCNEAVLDFMELGEDNKIFVKKNIIGGGIRKGKCPCCGSSDRERYINFILDSYCSLFDNTEKKILHFAPEKNLQQKIRQNKYNEYITADIEEGRADVIADIRELQFENEEFDFVICNHVLEHIDREKETLNELWRILKYGGILICSVPICWEEDTFEDKNIVSESDRLKYYGQRDHIRLYGRDFSTRLADVGFDVTCYKSDEICEITQIEKNGFIFGDSCFVAKKINRINR